MSPVKRKGLVGLAVFFVLLVISLLYLLNYRKTHPSSLTLNIKDENVTIPAYPRAKIIASATDPEEGIKYIGDRFSSTWESNASVPEVSKWYREKFTSEGWKLDLIPADPNADIQQTSFFNDKYTLYVSVFKDPSTKKTKIVTEYQTEHPDTYEVGENEEEETEDQKLIRERQQELEKQ